VFYDCFEYSIGYQFWFLFLTQFIGNTVAQPDAAQVKPMASPESIRDDSKGYNKGGKGRFQQR